jgi:hypothetical protein
MSKANVLKMASELVDENPDAAKLLIQLSKSETGVDIMSALDSYDENREASTVSL